MYVLDYIFFLVSAFGCYAVGLNIVRAGPLQTCILGLSIQALFLGISVWFIPHFTRELLTSIQLLALVAAALVRGSVIREHWQTFLETARNPTTYLALLASIAIAIPFSLHEYPFNSHDPVYWGFVVEALQADYSGRLQSPILSPLTLSVTHLLPMMSLSVLMVFIPNPTLITVILLKHLFVIFFFWRLGWALLHDLKRKELIYASLLFGSLFFIFESELGYNLLVSSFFYQAILLEVAIILIVKRSDVLLLLLFVLALAASRGPLAYAALGGSAILVWQLRSQLTKVVALFSILVLANIVSWLALPKPFAFFCNDASLSIVNPFSIEELRILSAIGQWVLPSSITNTIYQVLDLILGTSQRDTFWPLVGVISAFFSYAFLKFFMPIFCLMTSGYDTSFKGTVRGSITFYLMALWAGMFILRIGGRADHQFHSFLVLSVFAFFALFHLGKKNHLLGIVLLGLGVHGALFDGLTSKPFSAILSQGITREHLKYREDGTWLASTPHRLWHVEVDILASGQRRGVNELSSDAYSTYFKEEPKDLETIASLWVVPRGALRHECDVRKR